MIIVDQMPILVLPSIVSMNKSHGPCGSTFRGLELQLRSSKVLVRRKRVHDTASNNLSIPDDP